MTILLAPIFFKGLFFLVAIIIGAICFLSWKLGEGFFGLIGKCFQGLYDVGIFIRDTPARELMRILFEILILCAKGLYWLLVRVFLLLMAVASAGGIFELFFGFENWPMVVVGIVGVICIVFNAASDLKKFEEKMPNYSKNF
jgi:hypothetical protein